jgi:hypothetical protein
METTLSIRPVGEKDLPVLRDFAEFTFRAAWQHMNEPVYFEQYCREKFDPAALRAEWEQPESRFFLVFRQNAPIAYLKLNYGAQPEEPLDGPALQLERLYVHPEHTGGGIGAELLDFVENEARQSGAGWLWLSVWQESPRSVAFYEKNGFEIFGVETFWVGDDPQPDWLMKRAL